MKERPILFSAPMITAILAGRKTQTRRVVKPQPDAFWDEPNAHAELGLNAIVKSEDHWINCPFGAPGDRLWVRENFWYDTREPNECVIYSEDQTQFQYRTGGKGVQTRTQHSYVADACAVDISTNKFWKQKPSIFMPRWASRTTLEVTAVRVERLQKINEADIDAEGLDQFLIDSLISSNAANFDVKPEHWVHGSDEVRSFCYDCAVKDAERLKKKFPKDADDFHVDGGWGVEGDTLSFCETCHIPLRNSLTTWGCEQELEHFEEYGFNAASPDDCYSLERILGSNGFLDELGPRVKKLSWQALWQLINGKKSWDVNPWVWVVSFKRI